MSTRATIKLTYKAGNTIQMYHHCDGYPEYMEKHFELEKEGTRHTDIEYIWYVKLTDDGYDISYTEVNPKFDKIAEIEDDEEYTKKFDELFDGILAAKNGEKLYA